MNKPLIATLLALAFTGGAQAHTAGTGALTLNPGSVTDSFLAGTSAGAASAGTIAVSKFTDTSKVLTGASFTATLNQESIYFTRPWLTVGESQAALFATAAVAIGSGANRIASTGTSGTIRAADISAFETQTVALGTYSVSATAAANQLASLYGKGTVSASVAEFYTLNQTASDAWLFKGSTIADNVGERSATVVASYTSVNHATGGLGAIGSNSASSKLSLSFGDVVAGANASLGFNLYNVLGSYGLAVTGVSAGGSDLFSLAGITGTANLAAGGNVAGSVLFAPSRALGDYSGVFTISFADSKLGVGVGQNTTGVGSLTLNVSAHVISAPVAAVPEPETYAMLLAGLGLLGAVARRRRGC